MVQITKKYISTWGPLFIATVLAIAAHEYVYENRQLILRTISVASLMSGAWAIHRSGFRYRSVFAACACLAVGQFWLVQLLVTEALWKIGGYAP